MAHQSKTYQDRIDRADKGSHPLSRLLFSVLRGADAYLQYLILFGGLGHKLLSSTSLDILPAGPKGKVLVIMAGVCAAKQIVNMTMILEAKVPILAVIVISLFNSISNGVASLSALVYRPTNALTLPQYVGISLFAIGITTELLSEIQRKLFKDNTKNKGKLYTGGLFSLARHVNYGGYTLWRTGLALTSGNYWWAALTFTMHTYDFKSRAIPCLAEYCRNNYGESWTQYERDVPYVLFPYIY